VGVEIPGFDLRGARSDKADAGAVVAELREQLSGVAPAAVFVFAPCTGDSDGLIQQLASAFDPAPVLGATAIGQLDRDGFHANSVVAIALCGAGARVGVGVGECLPQSALSGGRAAVLEACAALGVEPDGLDRHRHVAVTLIDSEPECEELFVAGVASTAPEVAVVGGSASCQQRGNSRILAGGCARPRVGLVALIEPNVPFQPVISEHMVPRDGRVVVTATEAGGRVVNELDGYPAAVRFAQLLGVDEVTESLAARNPFGYYVGGRAYVRSVRAVEGDRLRFACGVERGTVLVPMKSGDMIAATREDLSKARQALGPEIHGGLFFNCYGRYLEARDRGYLEELEAVLSGAPGFGMSSFGEQVNALHVNHTLTGVAFGGARG